LRRGLRVAIIVDERVVQVICETCRRKFWG
jgi:hypothetical protein